VTAVRPAGAQPQPPDRQIQIVGDDQNLFRPNPFLPGEPRHRQTAQIHKRLGLLQKQRLPPEHSGMNETCRHMPCFEPPGRKSGQQPINHHESGIVTGPLVLAPRIAEADHQKDSLAPVGIHRRISLHRREAYFAASASGFFSLIASGSAGAAAAAASSRGRTT